MFLLSTNKLDRKPFMLMRDAIIEATCEAHSAGIDWTATEIKNHLLANKYEFASGEVNMWDLTIPAMETPFNITIWET